MSAPFREQIPRTSLKLQRLDVFVRDLLECDARSNIKMKLGAGFQKITQPAVEAGWLYLASGLLSFIGLTAISAAIVSCMQQQPFVMPLLIGATLLLPFLYLNTSKQELPDDRILASDPENLHLKALLFLHRKLCAGEIDVYSEEKDFGSPRRVRVSSAYFSQDHGRLKLLGTEAPKVLSKIGHWRRYSEPLMIDTDSAGELSALVTLRKLCGAPRLISELPNADFQLLVEQMSKVETVRWQPSKGLDIIAAFRTLYEVKRSKESAISALSEAGKNETPSLDTIREIVEGKNKSFNTKLDQGSKELVMHYIERN